MANSGKRFPLSYGQKALWFIQQFDPNCTAYNLTVSVRIRGALDHDALKKAFVSLIARQPSFRSIFPADEQGNPYRLILDDPAEALDFQVGERTTDLKRLNRMMYELNKIPFRLESDKPLRVRVYPNEGDLATVQIIVHHNNFDGSSRSLMIEQLQEEYAVCVGKSQPIKCDGQDYYNDFVKSQEKFVKSKAGERQLKFWLKKLEGELPTINLPTDFPRSTTQSHQGGTVRLNFDEKSTASLQKLATTASATSYALLYSLYRIVLHHYTGQEDVVVGSTYGGREERFANVFGYFVNKFALRTTLNEDQKFLDYLKQTVNSVSEAIENSMYPFPLLVEKLKIPRDPSRTPVFQTNFTFLNVELTGRDHGRVGTERKWLISDVDKAGMKWEFDSVDQQEGQFDLTLRVLELRNQYHVSFQYNSGLFREETIQQMARVLNHLVEQVVANPEIRLRDLEIVPAEDRTRLLVEFNETKFDGNTASTVVGMFDDCVKRFADRPAVVSRGKKLSYRELNAKVEALASYLLASGLKHGEPVALFFESSVETILGMLGVLKAGGAYLPIDTSQPASRVSYVLEDSGAKILLSNVELPDGVVFPGVHCDLHSKTWQSTAAQKFPTLTPSDPAYVIYTSGTTGNPKGTLIEQKCLVNYVSYFSSRYKITERTVAALLTSYAFDLGYTTLWTTILTGGELHMLPEALCKDVHGMLTYFRDHRVSFIKLTPSLLNAIVASHEFQQGDYCREMKIIVTGGEKIKTDDIAAIYSKYDSVKVVNHYGPTETTIGVMTFPIERGELHEFAKYPVIGRPIGNVKVYVVNKHLKLLPVGVPGEFLISGISVARGYLGRPELNKEKFIQNPFDHSLRAYRTGDLTRWRSNGTIDFMGRIDRQVKIRGYRVELGEIEQQLINNCGVKKAVVIERAAGQGSNYLCAYFVSEKTQEPSVIAEQLKKSVPDYMVPSYFVQLDEIPVTANGKLDARALPEPKVTVQSGPVLAADTETEKWIANLWARLLGVGPASVGVNDNFFKLGGHSLLVIRMLVEIYSKFRCKMPIPMFYGAPTIRELAAFIESQNGVSIEGGQTQNSSGPLTTTELAREAILDTDIQAGIATLKRQSQPGASPTIDRKRSRILLTGATGYLCGHVLGELLRETQTEIYCLVRGGLEAEKERLIEKLESDGYEGFDHSRLKVVKGDLAQPRLGIDQREYEQLTTKIDLVFHFGAWVNHVFSYADLKATNVEGTREVIRFAGSTKIKKIFFASTVSVKVAKETDSLDHGKALDIGYTQSKWVAEKMIQNAQEAGLPTTVFRLGLITWSMSTGASSLTQFESVFIKSCIELGAIPDLKSVSTLIPNLTPVDFTANSICQLAFAGDASGGEVYHLVNDQQARWDTIVAQINRLGYPLKVMNFAEWTKLYEKRATNGGVSQGAEFGAHLAQERLQRRAGGAKDGNMSFLDKLPYSSEMTMRKLGNPAIDVESEESVRQWLSYLADKEFIPAVKPLRKIS